MKALHWLLCRIGIHERRVTGHTWHCIWCRPELPANAVTSAELAYIQTRNRHRLFTVVHGELERCGISEPALAARLRISEVELNRLLGTPDCWTPDTASRILFAASGATLSYELTYPRWRSKAVPRARSDTATPAGKGETG